MTRYVVAILQDETGRYVRDELYLTEFVERKECAALVKALRQAQPKLDRKVMVIPNNQ